MANDSRSSSKKNNKDDDETKNSKGSTAPVIDSSSGLRRSARETPSKKKMLQCPSSTTSTRKSERLEKQTPPTPPPPVKRKSERVEIKRTPSPLRRSLRGNKKLNSMPEKTPASVSSDITRKNKNSVRQPTPTVEAGQCSKTKKLDSVPVQVENNKRMNARTYYKLFIIGQNKRDSTTGGSGGSIQAEEVGVPECRARTENELSEACETSLEGCESNVRMVDENNTVEDQSGENVSCSSQKESCKSKDEDGAEALEVDCSAEENLHTTEFLDSKSKERSDGTDLIGGDNEKPLNKKRNAEDMDVDASAMAASKDNCTSSAELSQPASKKQRLDINLPKQELCYPCDTRLDQEICDISTPKGRGEVEVTVTSAHAEHCNTNLQQMELPVDIQTDVDENSCVVCKLGGKLLCCDGKGCKRSYHVSCLNPPMEDVPPGAWHCLLCVRKKIESGVQSVSEGIESIWDAREVKVSDFDGSQNQKQYFVKYKGLAHVHNQWIPASELLLEAPSLVAKYNRKNQVTKWKLEWTMPHRLLKKRFVVLPMQSDEHHFSHAGNLVESHCEWLVKWRGLDYAHASWELANAPIFNTPEAERLIKEYENRHEKAKRASFFSNVDKILERKKGPLTKLVKLPVGGFSGIDNNHLISVNKLREHWHKGRNAVVFDDPERIRKVISFILSLQSDLCRPFLIVSASSALSIWEAEFLRLAPSIDVVVYSGNKDIRRSIRRLELYEEGRIMFQVLLSPPEAIVEDLELFKCLEWEAIILDDCQHSRISTHFERIKMLATGFRLLYVSGQLKDTANEYLYILSLLENGGDTSTSAGSDNIITLKERLSRHIAYECKSDSSRFAEYWVPVRISDVQLEQYCATLLSNSMSLRSCTKNDLMGEALREILMSVRKCCDHPYLVDSSLPNLLVKDLPVVEYLDVGIKASGKLQVLDKMLSEIKNLGLRVLILFQAIGGYGADSTGTYLDDLLRQRFGPDSYERIDAGGLVPSKKQAALNKFNNESGRFVFLLENRACLPSIKLSSVDCIIIFDSDWNPVNDLRALQKITIDSKSKQIKLFRLYTSCTAEEKVLILAKQDATLDISLHNINSSSSHMLLMWGALYLFNKCDEFHDRNSDTSFCRANISSDQSLLMDVIQEFMTILSQDGENKDTISSSTILKIQQNGGAYGGNGLLLGELEVQSMEEEELPHVFWTKLLEGRQPRWKYLSGSSQRNRKRVHYNENVSKIPEVESDEVVKKRKKVINGSIGLPSTKPRLEEGKEVVRDKTGTSGTPSSYASQTMPKSAACANDSFHANHLSTSPLCSNDVSPEPEAYLGESEEIRKRRDAQKNLHLLLKPEIFKLCRILKLKEDVKGMVGRLLEYIMDNHHVDRESATILQAFQLSLCWIAASLMNDNIDRKVSLAVAQQHLKFGCKEQEVLCIYTMLLKKLNSNGSSNIAGAPFIPVLASEDAIEDPEHARFSQSMASGQKVKLEVEDTPPSQECSSKHVFPMGLTPEIRMTEKDKLKAIKRVEKKSRKRMSTLLQKQDEEEHELNRIYEEKKAQLEKEFQVESAVVRSIHSHLPSRIDKLKILEEKYEKKLKEHSLQMDLTLQNLKERHVAAKNEEERMKSHLLEEVNSWPQYDLLRKVPLNESAHGGEHFHTSEEVTDVGPENVASVHSHLSEEQSIGGDVPRMRVGGVGLLGIPETVSNEIPETVTIETIPNKASLYRTAATETLSSKRVTVTGPDQQNRAGHSNDGPECPGYSNPPSGPKIHVGDILLEEGEIPSDVPETAPDEVVEGGQSSREHDGQSLVSSPSLQPIPAEGLNETLQPRDECSPAIQDGNEPENEKHNSSQVVEVTPLLLIDAVPSDNHEAPVVVPAVQSNHEAPVVVPAAQPDHEAPFIEPAVLLQPSSCTDSLPATQNANTQVDISRSHHDTPSVPSNQEVPVIETIVQLQLSPSTDLPSSQDHHYLPLVSGNDSQPGSQPDVPLIQNQPNPPSDCASVPGQSTNAAQVIEPVVQPSIGFPSSSYNPPELPSTNGTDYMRSREDHVCAQNAQSPSTVGNYLGRYLNQTPIRPATNVSRDSPIDTLGGAPLSRTRTMPVMSDFSNRSIQTASTASVMASRMPQHTYVDPLQNESERIRRETEQTTKIFEEAKLRINSDCEKEIEEVVAQIRRKYETMHQGIGAQYLLKKQELDANHKIVYMNKMLAEAFRSKCMDMRVSGKQGLTQQLVQLSLQQPTLRPPIVGGSSTVSLPAVRPRTVAPPRPPLVIPSSAGPPAHSTQSTAPPRPSTVAVPSSVGPLVATPQTTVPLLQVVHHPASLFSSAPTRPLHISTISPPAGNVQVGTAIRSPAPHLQPFRPSLSLPPNSLLSLPRGSPNQMPPSNPLDSASPLSQLSARPLPPPSAYGSHNRAPSPESVGGLRALHDSAMDFLRDNGNRSGSNLPNNLPPLPELRLNFDSLDLSDFGMLAGTQVNSTRAGVATDIVCLSDDE